MRLRTVLLSVTVAALTLVGCGGDPDETVGPPTTDIPTTLGSSTATSGVASVCEDAAQDSTMAIDLTRVSLDTTGAGVTLTYEWDGSVPPAGSVLWVTTVSSANGNTARQLGYKLVDAQPSAYFVFDFSAAQQENLSGSVHLTSQQLVASFPGPAVSDLGDGWRWTAVLNVDGNDADTCEPSASA